MICFRCDQEAVQECPRCGALYCDDHGEAMCERCMDPMLALPSHRVYRGSLFALLFGSVVAVSLLILPPAAADQDSPPGSIAGVVQTATPTPEATQGPESTPGPDGTAEPGGTATAEATTEATETPTPTPEATEEPTQTTYTVQPGDTLNAIASQFAPEGVSTSEMSDRIAEANGITNPSTIRAGQELIIPQ